MHSSLRIIFLFALLALALAAPHNAPQKVPQKRSFKVERIRNPNYKRTPGAGTRALIKAYAKYNMPLPGLLDAMNAAAAAHAAPPSDALSGNTAAAAGAGALGGLLGGAGASALGDVAGSAVADAAGAAKDLLGEAQAEVGGVLGAAGITQKGTANQAANAEAQNGQAANAGAQNGQAANGGARNGQGANAGAQNRPAAAGAQNGQAANAEAQNEQAANAGAQNGQGANTGAQNRPAASGTKSGQAANTRTQNIPAASGTQNGQAGNAGAQNRPVAGAGAANSANSTAAAGTGAAPKSTASKKPATPKSTGSASPFGSNSTAEAQGGAQNVTGKVTATPVDGDIEYLAPVSIGGQIMNLNFDSGSSDLWIFNTQLPLEQRVGHILYDPAKSANFKVLQGSNFSISYGDGSGASGNVGTDTVDIGGAVVENQAIELATAVSASFSADTASGGLVGLGFSKLNTVKPVQQKTFFDNVLPSLAEPVFTADLRKNAVGAYEFGAIDETKFNGSLTWVTVNATNGFWQFPSAKFAVGAGAPFDVAGAQAIADTGTTLMLVNPAVVNAYYSQVTGAVNNQTVGGVTFPCNSDLPDLNVDVGGEYTAVVRGSDINFAPVDAAGTTCFGGIQATAFPLQIYGDIFFKSQFVAFNAGNNTMGMAPHQ